MTIEERCRMAMRRDTESGDPDGRNGPPRNGGMKSGSTKAATEDLVVKKRATKEARVPPPSAARRKAEIKDGKTAGDGRVVIQIRVRRALRRLIKQLADNGDETVQTFILRILQDAGVPVTNEDLLDRRKGENRPRRGAAARKGQHSRSIRAAAYTQPLAELLAAALAEGSGARGQMPLGGCVVIINMGSGCGTGR